MRQQKGAMSVNFLEKSEKRIKRIFLRYNLLVLYYYIQVKMLHFQQNKNKKSKNVT